MTTPADLVSRNTHFAGTAFEPGLRINPVGNLMVIGCVDPRVDPAHVLGLAHGEAAVIRNVGGRMTPSTLDALTMLSEVGRARADGAQPGDWNLVLLHHTDCGMRDLATHPDLLVRYFGIPATELDTVAVSDPVASVRVDVDRVLQELHGPHFLVTGLVYDVTTGTVETVVAPTPLNQD